MVDKKITELTELATPASADVIAIVDDPAGSPETKKITYANMESNLSITASQVSDFDTEVGNNTDVTANTAKVTNATHTGDATGDTALTIANDAVTYGKMQNISATDKLLGRETAGAGDVEEITLTSAGRALLDDTSASAQRTTLDVDIAGTDNSTDVTLAGTPDYITITGQVITRNTIDISDDTNLVAGTNITLSADTLNIDDAFLKNDAVDVGVGLSLTGDNSSADTTYVPNVLYNTDATPPTASTVPIGTIYVQYTA